MLLPISPIHPEDINPTLVISEDIIKIFNELIASNYKDNFSSFPLREVVELIKQETDRYVFDIPTSIYPSVKRVYEKCGWTVELKGENPVYFYFIKK
jgi:hypothetical protein